MVSCADFIENHWIMSIHFKSLNKVCFKCWSQAPTFLRNTTLFNQKKKKRTLKALFFIKNTHKENHKQLQVANWFYQVNFIQSRTTLNLNLFWSRQWGGNTVIFNLQITTWKCYHKWLHRDQKNPTSILINILPLSLFILLAFLHGPILPDGPAKERFWCMTEG